MNDVRNMAPEGAILEGPVTLRTGSLVDHEMTSKCQTGSVRLGKAPRGLVNCRVEGGMGSQSLTLATVPHLRFVR